MKRSFFFDYKRILIIIPCGLMFSKIYRMSGIDQSESARPLNQRQMPALYESIRNTLDSTRRAKEALQLSSNEN
eukprot:snap_masked-scaffold_48-processed-gene-1.93-mRNA-1 protein AED:1.00 eAED:1.00 QI:0/-1/0/0/-1/1/1/0/73